MTPDRLPPALRLVLDEELAAGKEIIDAGCTFPAPQVLERIAAHRRFREGITNFRVE